MMYQRHDKMRAFFPDSVDGFDDLTFAHYYVTAIFLAALAKPRRVALCANISETPTPC